MINVKYLKNIIKFSNICVKSITTLKRFNENVVSLPASGIRDIMVRAAKLDLDASKEKVIHLEVGQPDFKTPTHIIDATIKALHDGMTTYCPNSGISELRDEIALLYSNQNILTNREQICVTTGAMMSMCSLFAAILEPGDECLLPTPGFPNYQQGVSLAHGKSVPYLCHPSDGYIPNINEIEKLITPFTKLIVICNPGNPTGATFKREMVKDLFMLAKKYGIFIISDEIYSDIHFDDENPHVCTAIYDELYDNPQDDSMLAVVSGVSKAFSMTGFRVGWTRASTKLISLLIKLQEPMTSCGSPFAQYGAVAALKERRLNKKDNNNICCVTDMTVAYKLRRDTALDILNKRNRTSKFIPGGAFYLPVDITTSGLSSREFALELLANKRVGVAPGIAFDTGYISEPLSYLQGELTSERIEKPISNNRAKELKILNSFVRVSLANSLDNVSRGITRICDLLDELEDCK